MKQWLTGIFIFLSIATSAQEATEAGKVSYIKDVRVDFLGSKMAEYNEAIANAVARTAPGYRLMVMTTTDRNAAISLRTRLLQLYPEQKVYMLFQSPFIKIKLGNFIDRKEADRFKKQLLDQKLVNGNIYIVPEKIEIKPEKTNTEE